MSGVAYIRVVDNSESILWAFATPSVVGAGILDVTERRELTLTKF